jgi:hypothetical protein
MITHMGAGSMPKKTEKLIKVEEMLRDELKRYSKSKDTKRDKFIEFMTRVEVHIRDIII